MRLRTIWTIPAMDFSERCRRSTDWAAQMTVMLLPKRVRYWTTMMALAKATRESHNVPATPLDEVLANMEGAPR